MKMKSSRQSLSQSGHGIIKKDASKKVQSTLSLQGDLNQTKTCDACGMSYYKYVKKDVEYHDKYHKVYLTGHQWVNSPAEILMEFSISKTEGKKSKKVTVKIIEMNRHSELQIRRVEEILKTVNLELNASEGSDSWRKTIDAPIKGKAFLAVINNKVAGICTTEPIEQKQSKWMRFKTQDIVPNQCNKGANLGISRIWVAPLWRRHGIAMNLLHVVLKNSIYGVTLPKSSISFSQPSTRGGMLSKHFNGVVHRSGEYLLPVYLES